MQYIITEFQLFVDHINDSDIGLFAFDYMSQTDAPFYSDYGNEKDVRVVHDFRYGMLL